MIGRVVHPYNLQKALEHVIANKGSVGVDGIKPRQIKESFTFLKNKLLQDITTDRYLPQPILGNEIPKDNGRTRLLGVPTPLIE